MHHRQLRKWHAVLGERVVALMGTDLVRHKDKWASGVKEMRDIFARLEGAGYSRESQMVREREQLCRLCQTVRVRL